MTPTLHPPHESHHASCSCEPCHRDLISALCWVLRSGAAVALKNEMSERDYVRLARICYRWERDGALPGSAEEEPS